MTFDALKTLAKAVLLDRPDLTTPVYSAVRYAKEQMDEGVAEDAATAHAASTIKDLVRGK